MGQSLILTVQLDTKAQAFYEDLRMRYFPPERNLIPAHLTLFHQLPEEDRISQVLGEAAEVTPMIRLTKPTPRSMGRGVAVFFESAQLVACHTALSRAFESDLIPQDRQRLRPHIVIQNKVDPETARRTLPLIQVSSLIEPHAIGLTLWRYLGGPWEHVRHFAFSDPNPRDASPSDASPS